MWRLALTSFNKKEAEMSKEEIDMQQEVAMVCLEEANCAQDESEAEWPLMADEQT